MLELKLLLLIGVANGAPILVRQLLGVRFTRPVDRDMAWTGLQPCFGDHKTWRGIVAACLLTTLAALPLGFDWLIGLLIGTTAMAGDLLASFIKRRMHSKPGSMMLGMDQVPESLLPLLAIKHAMGLEWLTICLLVVLFFVLELLISRILYHLHIRQHPY